MARNRQRAKERQARRKAQRQQGDSDANARKPGPTRRSGDDPIADDVLDELERESIVAGGADPVTPPPRSAGSSAEVLEYEQDLDGERGGQHFDPDQDVPEEDLDEAGTKRRQAAEKHKDRPRFVQFLIAVWAELQRVQWPDRQSLITLTGVVLGFVLIAGGYLGLLDAIASRVIQAIL